MSFQGVIQNKLKGGLAQEGTSERAIVLVCGMSAIPDKIQLNKPIKLTDVNVLSALGVTEESDLARKELAAYHVAEMFRLAPESSFYLLPVSKTEKISTLSVKPEFLSALKSIDSVAVVGFASLAADTSVSVAVQAAQVMVNMLASEFIYLDAVLVEGLGTYLEDTVSEYADLRELEADTVSVIIAQDPGKASQDAAYASHAAIGATLGMIAVRDVHENVGSVDIEVKPRTKKSQADYPLTDKLSGRFLTAGLSNGTLISSVSAADQTKLSNLGYIYAGSFAGYPGVFLSNSCTCCEADSDYAYIERNSIWNKAARIIRETMIPRIRSKVEADPATGYVKSTTISDWDGRIRKALEPMVASGNIADFDIYINPKQIAVSKKPFQIQVKLVADGVVHEFEVDLGFTNKI